ncbi:HlyD family secretion protein [Chitinophaga barathri]|uniref:HlyD family efflux transporter periplasmic adaptor subunit n=1 Tax=Chitinophaga barathri TaxID=1647451 RepID=A0A3N4M7S1_9BACT|nr:HlyD family efflux transporter periplasmic adaptor subunit [Chitinophaga barathri]RPD39401.1 HlyD family efflux transporter periplasmic adaptor subunit [Chitinophaga barathri]
MQTTFLSFALVSALCFTACSDNEDAADAYGNFESTEVIVSAEATGRLLSFDVEEGAVLAANTLVGGIDSIQLKLRKDQLGANIRAVLSKKPDVSPQLAVIRQQIATQQKEKTRIENLFKANAATSKQLDDINAAIAVLEKQYASTASSLNTQVTGISSETQPLQVQVEQVREQLAQSRVVNPVNGTVLTKYVEKGEVVTYGKPLYKIADLQTMYLRAYISENQLSRIKTGQQVNVQLDQPDGTLKSLPGTVSWIASEAEFTPKTIQTREERVHLVYALKVRVQNDGSLKIGMPGEMRIAK